MSPSLLEASGHPLLVLPIGGCGEVGLNATLLADGPDALLIDCGMMPNLADAPGVDRAIPSFEPLAARRLVAVVLTHGHEDHIGAVVALMEAHPAPIYGPPLAIALLRAKLEGQPALAARLHPIAFGEPVVLAPFRVEWIRVTHSLPDSAALLIETRAGRVLHSGDFKLDPTPLDGRCTDLERLRAIGEAGVELLLSESTNSERAGHSVSEQVVGASIERLIDQTAGRVVVASFASHFHRLEGVVRSALRSGRRIALLGRALEQSWRIGLEQRLLSADPTMLVDAKKLGRIPRKELVLVVTGSQGEPRAGLSRVARGAEAALAVAPGDRVILSASTIPGNERAVRKIKNAIAASGVELVHDAMAPVHCSGHAHQAEQAELLRLIRPRCFVPIHGDRAMLERHARTAEAEGVPRDRISIVEDGQSVILGAGRLERGPEEPVPPRAIDLESGQLLPPEALDQRRKLAAQGLLVCSVALDRPEGVALGPPILALRGLPMLPAELVLDLRTEVQRTLERLAGQHDLDREAELRGVLRRLLAARLGSRPVIEVHVMTPEIKLS